jgi:hypothetical protein
MGILLDDSHLKGNIFAGVENDVAKARELPEDSERYRKSKAEVQRKKLSMRKRLYPQTEEMPTDKPADK